MATTTGVLSNYPSGFSGGVTIRGLPILNTYSKQLWWADSGGSRTGRGTFDVPFATLAAAVAAASAGDTIMVKEGHTETISSSTALTIATAGLQIIGLGRSGRRPKFTLDTGTGSTINVTANDVSIMNMVFVANFADIVTCFALTTATGFMLDGCEFRDTASNLNFNALVTTDTTSNHADGLSLLGCAWYGLGATANTAVVKMTGTNDRLRVMNSYFAHAAVTAAGFMPISTGKVVTNMLCYDNTFNFVGATSLTTGTLITTNGSTNSGVLGRNFVFDLDATTEILVTAASGFHFFDNKSSAVADASGYVVPTADS